MVSSAEAMFSCLFILVFGAVALCGTGAGQLPVVLKGSIQPRKRAIDDDAHTCGCGWRLAVAERFEDGKWAKFEPAPHIFV